MSEIKEGDEIFIEAKRMSEKDSGFVQVQYAETNTTLHRNYLHTRREISLEAVEEFAKGVCQCVYQWTTPSQPGDDVISAQDALVFYSIIQEELEKLKQDFRNDAGETKQKTTKKGPEPETAKD